MIIFTSRILKIAGGNTTALIYNCPDKLKSKTAKLYLKQAEQVGFISKENSIPKLNMMGGELCINATIAFASQLKKSGFLLSSRLSKPIEYNNKDNTTTIKISIRYKMQENIVLFNGIGFIFINKVKQKITKAFLKKLSKKYKLPAFGAINYEKNKIFPYVYVQKVNSFVKETACGSGSLAFSIFSGYKKIIQPTGKVISIKRNKGKFEISANVNKENINKSSKAVITIKKGVNMENKINILFICKYNVFRSRVAETYFNTINKNKNIKAKSAGIMPGEEMNKMRMQEVRNSCIRLIGNSKGLSMDLMNWQNIIVIVANNVPPSLFKKNKKYGKKLIIWRIRDTKDREGKDIPKIIRRIKKKVDKLNKKLEKGKII